MRERWRIVLVDEFQDTDPVQWQVLERAFGGHATMVLIGDPKQAIYAFRGGDVVTYLAAARTAATAGDPGDQLAQRRRPGRRGSQVVLRGAALGDPEIVVRDVAAHHRWPDRDCAGCAVRRPRRRSGCAGSRARGSGSSAG